MWYEQGHVNICSGQCGVHGYSQHIVVDNVVTWTVNICSGQCGGKQSTYVVDNVVVSTYVVDNVVYSDTVNICSGQYGVHGYSVNICSGQCGVQGNSQHM